MKGLIFTYALTYGGAVVSLYRPFYGLLVYVCFAILKPEALWHWSVPAGNYSRIVAIALLIGWALNGFGNWRLGKGTSIWLCFAGFWFWALLSTLLAALFPERGYAFLEAIGKILLPFTVGMTVIENMSQVKQLAWTIAGSVAYMALEMNISYYSGYNQLHDTGFGGMDNNCVAIELVAAVGFMFFLGFAADKWWQKAIAMLGSLLMINAIMFSFSRGGLLALIITGGAAFVIIPERPVHYLVLLGAIAAGIRLAGKEVLERFSTTLGDAETGQMEASAGSRLELWADCWTLMLREPVFGVGPNHFPFYAHTDFGWPMGKEAHSLWFNTGAEMGFIGLGLLLGFYLLTMRELYPLTKKSFGASDSRIGDVARMVIVSTIGFMVAAQFVSLEGLEMPYYVALVGVATLKIVSRPETVPGFQLIFRKPHVHFQPTRAAAPV